MAVPNKLAKARVIVSRKIPGLVPIIKRLAYKDVEGIEPRLVVNGRGGILYNPEAVNNGKPTELAFDLANRIMHVAARHHQHAEDIKKEFGKIDKTLWGEMADISINPALLAAGLSPGTNADGTSRAKVPEDYGMPRGWGAKRYYREAIKRGMSREDDPKADEKADGSGAGDTNKAEETEEGQTGPGAGAVKLILKGWAEWFQENKSDLKLMVGLLPGTMPADMELTVADIFAKPVTDWREEFRRTLGNALVTAPGWSQLCFTRRSRMQAAYGAECVGVPTLPGRNTRLPRVMVIVDCSGSMTLELEGAKAEVANIVDAYGAPVDFVTFDTKVNIFPRLKDVTAVKATKLKGGGGTDITPVVEYIRSLPRHKRPRVVVSITDGWVGDCGPAIPGVEYLWVLTAVGVVPAKYGKVFRLPPIKAPSY